MMMFIVPGPQQEIFKKMICSVNSYPIRVLVPEREGDQGVTGQLKEGVERQIGHADLLIVSWSLGPHCC